MNLLVNACTRANSRTLRLAHYSEKAMGGEFCELPLYDMSLLPITEADLIYRDSQIAKGDFSPEMFSSARLFAEAENIIIAAPYWDLSFPSVLKLFVEYICVSGLTFKYTAEGFPVGLCRAKRLVYVTTAGGYIPEPDFGFSYIETLCKSMFGITNVVCIKAEALDIIGTDVELELSKAERAVDLALS